MLIAQEIRAKKLIRNDVDSSYRDTTYDLRAGKIIRPDGEECDSYVVPPQGLVEVISLERVAIPKNISGVATVKTGLSTNGMLALNIGIIDPDYNGPISSFLLNFSKVPYRIERGDVFLRSYFFEIPGEGGVKEDSKSDVDYVKDKKRKISGNFGSTFLNVDEIANDLVKNYAFKALGFIAGVSLIVSISSFLANYSMLSLMRSWVDPKTSVERDIKERLTLEMRERDAEISALREKIDLLERERVIRAAVPSEVKKP